MTRKEINWESNNNILDLLDNKYKEEDLPLMENIYLMTDTSNCKNSYFRKLANLNPKITKVKKALGKLTFFGEQTYYDFKGYLGMWTGYSIKCTERNITGSEQFQRSVNKLEDLNKNVPSKIKWDYINNGGSRALFKGVKNDNKNILQQVITLYENYNNFDDIKAVIDAKIENTEIKIKQAKDLIKKELKNKKNIIDLYNL